MSPSPTYQKSNPYALIPKAIIYNQKLSFGALGLLTYALSMPGEWNFDLEAERDCNRCNVYSLLNELIQARYCLVIVDSDDYIFEFFDDPDERERRYDYLIAEGKTILMAWFGTQLSGGSGKAAITEEGAL